MATIGLSKPYYAIYNHDEETGTVTYSGLSKIGKAVSVSVEVAGSSDNVLYADNGPAESDNRFSNGTLTLGIDELMPEEYCPLLGLKMEPLAIDGMTTADPYQIAYGEEQTIPYVGAGFIFKHQKNGQTKYRPLILPKVQFANPSQTANTQGETIEWQTPKLTASILRDDTPAANWKVQTSFFDTESDAELYIKHFFGAAATVDV